MKRLFYFTLLGFTFLFLNSCEEEKKNDPPECEIVSPINNASFDWGETIIISVEASDPEGNLKEVRFYINNIGISSAQSFPFNYDWNTNDDEPGNYLIKATAIDNKGLETSDEVSIIILSNFPPTVTTSIVTNITPESAECGGEVTDDGGKNVTNRGVCWNTSGNPTTSNSHTDNGNGVGIFTSTLDGLSPETTYYVRAYAINSAGTSYGNQINFTTTNVPTITTSSITNITHNSAKSGGTITSDGGAPVTFRGICWSYSPNPTLEENVGYTNDGSGGGSFNSSLTGLFPDHLYYVRAFAKNSAGTAYGNQLTFITTGTQYNPIVFNPSLAYGTVSDIDGNTYKTIEIDT